MRSINYTIGNLLETKQQALVNPVNLEGFMGKGIAYQFKTQFPKNNKAYVSACNDGNIGIGKVFVFKEKDKIIINFPTKDKWREKAKIEYIECGLKSLIETIKKDEIKSIAIPPLGCGNGGLSWSSVKSVIEQAMMEVDDVDVLIYEPSENFISTSKSPPKTTLSHLIVLGCMRRLKQSNQIPIIQKAIFMMNILSGKNFFEFDIRKYTPYSRSVKIAYEQINKFLKYYCFSANKNGLEDATKLMYKNMMSNKLKAEEKKCKFLLDSVCDFCNDFADTKELEICTMILCVLFENPKIEKGKIFEYFKKDINVFSDKEIENGIEILIKRSFLKNDLFSIYRI